ncbi:HIT family protein [Clostridium saccharoperbutylacetonicum]|uniref:HIT family protein n=1 Tax=Clostridium saccharoperbutylacetonicum TaxID=36745 RepID=UPI0039EAF0FC
MNFDEKCFYCSRNEELDKLMIKICDLEVSTVYLFKEQTYKGRCNVVFKEHKSEVAELTEQEASSFIKDVRRVAQAMHKAFTPNKINYGAFADTMKHLHFHLVPKYEGGHSWGGTFEMNPQQVYLSDEEYNELIDKVKKNL